MVLKYFLYNLNSFFISFDQRYYIGFGCDIRNVKDIIIKDIIFKDG